jgi:hypothetical protein
MVEVASAASEEEVPEAAGQAETIEGKSNVIDGPAGTNKTSSGDAIKPVNPSAGNLEISKRREIEKT